MSKATLTRAALFAAAIAAGCGERGDEATAAGANPRGAASIETATPDPEVAVLTVASHGRIVIELFSAVAPGTVANFVKLAREGFYDGTTFHRVIPGFMIQSGDPLSKDRDPRDDGQGGPGYTIPDEHNATPHVRGVVSMANTGQRHSAGSQFFILHADSRDLDGGYTAFGRVVQGMDVVDAITRVEIDKFGRRGPPDRPVEKVLVESIRIEPRGGAQPATESEAPAAAPPAPSSPAAPDAPAASPE
jgi:peptidyl-prolyl cis-trans isomerase B (cyclophilin B)